MDITLEKIELVKDRTGVTYKEAKESLEKSEGSVVDAIIEIEENLDKNYKVMAEKKTALVDEIKAIIKKGNVSRIQVKKSCGEVVLNIPVNVGIAGAILAPITMLIGGVAAFSLKYVIEVIKEDGTIIDISDKTNDALERAAVKGNEMYEKVINSETYEKVKGKAEETVVKATDVWNSKFSKDADKAVSEVEDFAENFDISEMEEKADELIEEGQESLKSVVEEVK